MAIGIQLRLAIDQMQHRDRLGERSYDVLRHGTAKTKPSGERVIDKARIDALQLAILQLLDRKQRRILYDIGEILVRCDIGRNVSDWQALVGFKAKVKFFNTVPRTGIAQGQIGGRDGGDEDAVHKGKGALVENLAMHIDFGGVIAMEILAGKRRT